MESLGFAGLCCCQAPALPPASRLPELTELGETAGHSVVRSAVPGLEGQAPTVPEGRASCLAICSCWPQGRPFLIYPGSGELGENAVASKKLPEAQIVTVLGAPVL